MDERSIIAWDAGRFVAGDVVFGYLHEGRWWIPLYTDVYLYVDVYAVLFGAEARPQETMDYKTDPTSGQSHLVVEHPRWAFMWGTLLAQKRANRDKLSFLIHVLEETKVLHELLALSQQIFPQHRHDGRLFYACRHKIDPPAPVYVRGVMVPEGTRERPDPKNPWVVGDPSQWFAFEAAFRPAVEGAKQAAWSIKVQPEQLLEFVTFRGFSNRSVYGQWFGQEDSPPFERRHDC